MLRIVVDGIHSLFFYALKAQKLVWDKELESNKFSTLDHWLYISPKANVKSKSKLKKYSSENSVSETRAIAPSVHLYLVSMKQKLHISITQSEVSNDFP